jgi:hypothetical protein
VPVTIADLDRWEEAERLEREAEKESGKVYFTSKHGKPPTFCFLSGPMSGMPLWNRELFIDFRTYLVEQVGWEVYSPSDREATQGFDFEKPIGPDNTIDLQESWRHNMAAICESDCLVLLPGWRKSQGSLLELQLAIACDIPVWQGKFTIDDAYEISKLDTAGMQFRMYPPAYDSRMDEIIDSIDPARRGQAVALREYGEQCLELVVRKNADYGGSVWQSPVAAGGISAWYGAWVRLSDKIARVWQIFRDPSRRCVEDESMADTLRDIVGYAIVIGCGWSNGFFSNDDES